MPEAGYFDEPEVSALCEVYGEATKLDPQLSVRAKGKRGRKAGPDTATRAKALMEFDPAVHSNEVVTVDGLPDFHNASPPEHVILQEKPEHRFLVYLFGQGLSVKEVFLQLGGQWDDRLRRPIKDTGQYSYAWLTQIRRQSWFRQHLINFWHQSGKDMITAKLQAEVGASIDTVIEIRDNTSATEAVRLSAANSLIDRFLGKPTMTVKTETIHGVDHYEQSAEQLQRELDQVDTELKNLNAAF